MNSYLITSGHPEILSWNLP